MLMSVNIRYLQNTIQDLKGFYIKWSHCLSLISHILSFHNFFIKEIQGIILNHCKLKLSILLIKSWKKKNYQDRKWSISSSLAPVISQQVLGWKRTVLRYCHRSRTQIILLWNPLASSFVLWILFHGFQIGFLF